MMSFRNGRVMLWIALLSLAIAGETVLTEEQYIEKEIDLQLNETRANIDKDEEELKTLKARFDGHPHRVACTKGVNDPKIRRSENCREYRELQRDVEVVAERLRNNEPKLVALKDLKGRSWSEGSLESESDEYARKYQEMMAKIKRNKADIALRRERQSELETEQNRRELDNLLREKIALQKSQNILVLQRSVIENIRLKFITETLASSGSTLKDISFKGSSGRTKLKSVENPALEDPFEPTTASPANP